MPTGSTSLATYCLRPFQAGAVSPDPQLTRLSWRMMQRRPRTGSHSRQATPILLWVPVPRSLATAISTKRSRSFSLWGSRTHLKFVSKVYWKRDTKCKKAEILKQYKVWAQVGVSSLPHHVFEAVSQIQIPFRLISSPLGTPSIYNTASIKTYLMKVTFTLFILLYFFSKFIWLHWVLVAARGIQFSDQGSNPGPLPWELRVLTTEPPGKSLKVTFKSKSWSPRPKHLAAEWTLSHCHLGFYAAGP